MPIANIARPVIARPTNNILPTRNALAPRQPLAVDTFMPSTPVAQQNNIQPAPVAQPAAQSSGGGFLSGLWDRLKNVFSGLLGQANQAVDQAAPGLFSKATGFVGNLLSGLFSKAMGWINGLFTSAQNKLTQ